MTLNCNFWLLKNFNFWLINNLIFFSSQNYHLLWWMMDQNKDLRFNGNQIIELNFQTGNLNEKLIKMLWMNDSNFLNNIFIINFNNQFVFVIPSSPLVLVQYFTVKQLVIRCQQWLGKPKMGYQQVKYQVNSTDKSIDSFELFF